MNRRKKIFNRVVNPLLSKYLTDPHGSETSIAKNIPMKYLKYFKEKNIKEMYTNLKNTKNFSIYKLKKIYYLIKLKFN